MLEANRFVGEPMTVFVALLRGLPEIIVVLLVYFGSTELVEMLTGEYIEFGGIWLWCLRFLSFCSLCFTNITRRNSSYSKGQWESGAALELKQSYTFIHIVMPQVWRHALPGLSNQWLVLLKRYGIGFINWCGRFDAPSGS